MAVPAVTDATHAVDDPETYLQGCHMVTSLARALQALQLLAHETAPFSASDLGDRLGLNQTAASKVLASLQAEGWVRPQASDTFIINQDLLHEPFLRTRGQQHDRDRSERPLERLRSLTHRLTGPRLRTSEQILSDPSRIGRLSITKLAAAANTSPSTVTRLAAELGYDGFPALRAAIAIEHGQNIQLDWEHDDTAPISPNDTLHKIVRDHIHSVRLSADTINTQAANQGANLIANAKLTLITGTPQSAEAAWALVSQLQQIGQSAWRATSNNDLRSATRLLGANDVAVAVVGKELDRTTEDFLQLGRASGAFTVAITHSKSTINSPADVRVDAGKWDTDVGTEQTIDMIVVKLLVALVEQRANDSGNIQ